MHGTHCIKMTAHNFVCAHCSYSDMCYNNNNNNSYYHHHHLLLLTTTTTTTSTTYNYYYYYYIVRLLCFPQYDMR